MKKAKANQCVHFNGTQNDCCKAGVNYVGLHGSDGKLSIPCLGPKRYLKEPFATCPKKQLPTAEEIAAYEADLAEHMAKSVKALEVAMEVKARHKLPGGRFRSGVERMPCPACGTGKLTIAVSGYNGHTHGRCSTDDCVAWIE